MNFITIDLRPVLSILGIFLVGLSVAMLIPAATDLIYGNLGWQDFLISAVITSFFGLMFFGSNGFGNPS